MLAAFACGNTPPPAKTVEPVAPPRPSPAKVTCNDAGIVLRGELSSGDDVAGKAREQAIEAACREDKWAQAILDCVASTPRADECLDDLTDAQRTSYDQRLADWDVEYGSGMAGGIPGMAGLDCATVLVDVSHFPPLIDATSPERDWHIKARTAVLDEHCDHDWQDAMRNCVVNSADETAALSSCIAQELAPDEAKALTDELDRLASLATKIADVKKKPKSITCKAVVQAHYADARWKDKLDGFKAAERKRMIADSRDAMTKACTADAWDETMRACIVVDGGQGGARQECFVREKLRWGYPATGTVTKVGIAECDDYAAAVAKLTSCNLLSQASRDQIARSQQQMLVEIARMPSAQRAKMATSCKAAMDAIASTSTASGC